MSRATTQRSGITTVTLVVGDRAGRTFHRFEEGIQPCGFSEDGYEEERRSRERKPARQRKQMHEKGTKNMNRKEIER